jgi:hypothetical protein
VGIGGVVACLWFSESRVPAALPTWCRAVLMALVGLSFVPVRIAALVGVTTMSGHR